jgi:hypothetical protein
LAESKELLEKLILYFLINTAKLVPSLGATLATLVSLMEAIPQFFEGAQHLGRSSGVL